MIFWVTPLRCWYEEQITNFIWKSTSKKELKYPCSKDFLKYINQNIQYSEYDKLELPSESERM